MVDALKCQWDVLATLNRDKRYHRIRIAVESVARFKHIVEPYILAAFAYKFPLMTP